VTLLASAHSTHDAVIVNGALTALSVVVTAVLALVAVAALRAANRQAREAGDAVEEGRRSRVDARAPAVFIYVELPDWPPLQPSTIGGAPQPLRPGASFTVPGQDEEPVFLRYPCVFTNYGVIPAKVRVKAPIEMLSSSGRAIPRQEEAQFVLAPGKSESGMFLHDERVRTWREGERSVVRRVVVADQFKDGVLDTTNVVLTANPLETDPVNSGRLTVRSNQAAPGAASAYGTAYVEPTERIYRRLYGSPAEVAAASTRRNPWWAPWRRVRG
jgi:hypothetical protein